MIKLDEKRIIELNGYEMATTLGALRYIKDYKKNALGTTIRYINTTIEKIEKASNN